MVCSGELVTMEAIIQEKIIPFVDVIMRVPPLFIIDELLRIGLGNRTDCVQTSDGQTEVPNYCIKHVDGGTIGFATTVYETLVFHALKFLICFVGCATALCIFVLTTRHLITVYLYLLSIGVIFVSYWSNVSTVKAITAYLETEGNSASILDDILSLNFNVLMNHGPGYLIVQNYMLQYLLGFVFCYVHFAPRYGFVQKALLLSFWWPSILGISPISTSILHHAPVFATLPPLLLSKFVIWDNSFRIIKTIHVGYKHTRNFTSNFGLSALAETQWTRINVPRVLRTFWMLRVGEQIFQILGNQYGEETFTFYTMIKTLLINGCETLTALLGMTSIISYICHYIGCFSQRVLLTEDDDDEKSIGTVSAVLFYILALQTGLTSLDREKRLVRLCRNFCLLFTAVLHFVHNIVNPLLMSLSASHNPAVHRHVRALAVCVVLIIFPVSLLVFLWSHFTINTWLLAVSVFSIEVIVKVLVSLAIYSLFLFDAYRRAFWEQLDDWVYMIRSFGNTVEFAFGIILFFNGFWILVFESGGAIRAVMMCIHAYFNIWCEARAGWNVFMKRRTAVNKINLLPEANSEQLRTFNDVCAICYQDMENARITMCNHYFHGVCLRKWLYIQDRCPLCHYIMYRIRDEGVVTEGAAVDDHAIRDGQPHHER